MRKIVYFLFVCLSSGAILAQDHTERFFRGMSFASNMDTLSLSEFNGILNKYPADFNQALFTFGSDNQEDWEMITKAIREYPEIVKPIIHQVDMNSDGKQDLVLSFTAGQEYAFVGFYIAEKKGYSLIYSESGEFYGMYENGDLCYVQRACCDDPTDDFHRLQRIKKQSLMNVDMLSVSSYHIDHLPNMEEIFKEDVWIVTSEILYPVANMERYGAFLPGAKLRLIKEELIEGEKLMFCEIIGELDPASPALIYPHAFAWLSNSPKFKKAR